MTFTGINPKFAIKSNFAEQKYPALQINNYRPLSLNEKIDFCFSETSFDLLFLKDNILKTEIIECIYDEEKILMHKIVSPVRWIFLNIPRIFVQDKDNKEVFVPEKGIKLFGTNRVTVAKCFLACQVGDELLLDIEGMPQIFTLKLTSTKTQLIGYGDGLKERTILSLNREIQKNLKTKDNLVHLVSVNIQPTVKKFVSSHSGKSSLGVDFELVGNAKVLLEFHQQQIFDLVNNQEVADILNDPFGLKLKNDLNSLNNSLEADSTIDF